MRIVHAQAEKREKKWVPKHARPNDVSRNRQDMIVADSPIRTVLILIGTVESCFEVVGAPLLTHNHSITSSAAASQRSVFHPFTVGSEELLLLMLHIKIYSRSGSFVLGNITIM